ncbi:MAG TPA: VTT domain-containing protein [Terracidiphilus sp.]|jgi:membrane protein YqaA with SNARE-associated domain
MKFFAPVIHVLFHIGILGPFLMGILDSSFLVLPFGNDLLVVALVVRHPKEVPWYVLSAAAGSTVGAFLLASVSRKLGEKGISRNFGRRRFEKLRQRVGSRSGFAVALAGLAPPPFPFTIVIAAVAAVGYPQWKIMATNFFARGVRFTILSFLALRFGRDIVRIAKTGPFEITMAIFIIGCFVASGFSVAHWLRHPRKGPEAVEAA